MTNQFWVVCLCLVLGVAFSAKVDQYYTRQSTNDRLTKYTLTFGASNASLLTISLNENDKRQKITGFGGAFTEAGAYNLFSLSSQKQQEILDLYFSDAGLQYSLCRFHINSCDFSLGSYSSDDEAYDMTLSNFTIAHDQKTLIPFILGALKSANGRPIKIFGTPWSPPWWMKNNAQPNVMDGSALPVGLNRTMFDVWAQYLSMTVSAYEAAGIPIWGLTPQNEPEFAAPWEACVYTPDYMAEFISKSLGPRMKQDHPQLHLLGFDHNRDHMVNWTKVLFGDQAVWQYLSGLAFHWYFDSCGNGNTVELAQADNVAASSMIIRNAVGHDDFELFGSEACNCPGVNIDQWVRGEDYGYDIATDIQHGATGWVDWNMVLDPQGGPNHLQGYCDAPIVAFANNDTYHIQPPYWYLGAFSKFMPPDTRIYGMNLPYQLNFLNVVGGIRPDGRRVVVVVNHHDVSATFQLQFNGQAVPITAHSHSIQTLLY